MYLDADGEINRGHFRASSPHFEQAERMDSNSILSFFILSRNFPGSSFAPSSNKTDCFAFGRKEIAVLSLRLLFSVPGMMPAAIGRNRVFQAEFDAKNLSSTRGTGGRKLSGSPGRGRQRGVPPYGTAGTFFFPIKKNRRIRAVRLARSARTLLRLKSAKPASPKQRRFLKHLRRRAERLTPQGRILTAAPPPAGAALLTTHHAVEYWMPIQCAVGCPCTAAPQPLAPGRCSPLHRGGAAPCTGAVQPLAPGRCSPLHRGGAASCTCTEYGSTPAQAGGER
jgi:hypothetical protein